VRRNWYTDDYIHADVRQLFNRTEFPDIVSPRIRLLRTSGGAVVTPIERPIQQAIRSSGILQFPSFLPSMVPSPFDISGNTVMEMDLAVQLIQNALFRL
jgi:hypothetical protein